MSEDCRRLSRETRRCFDDTPTNSIKFNLRDKRDITEIIDIFTCEDIISSHVRISYRFYQFVTTRYTTDFYIIKLFSTRYLTFLPFLCNDTIVVKLLALVFFQRQSTRCSRADCLLVENEGE